MSQIYEAPVGTQDEIWIDNVRDDMKEKITRMGEAIKKKNEVWRSLVRASLSA